MADTHFSFALLKALCDPISPPSSNYWDWKAKYFQYSLKFEQQPRNTVWLKVQKKNLLQEKVDISIPHPTSTAFFFQRYWKEILVSWSTTGMWLILSTFFHLHTSLCLEHGHVMTGSTAAILLLWDKTVWQGIAESKNRRGVFDFSESLLSSGLFTFSLFVVWVKVKPYIFVLLYLVFCL